MLLHPFNHTPCGTVCAYPKVFPNFRHSLPGQKADQKQNHITGQVVTASTGYSHLLFRYLKMLADRDDDFLRPGFMT